MKTNLMKFYCIMLLMITNIAFEANAQNSKILDTYDVDLRGGLSYLPNGDIVGFSGIRTDTAGVSSFDLIKVEIVRKEIGKVDEQADQGIQVSTKTGDITSQPSFNVSVLKTFSGNFSPVFVKPDINGVLFGISGNSAEDTGRLFKLDSDTSKLKEIFTQQGLLDAIVVDPQSAYILYKNGSSSGVDIALLSFGFESEAKIIKIISLDTANFKSLALQPDGSLFVVGNLDSSKSKAIRFSAVSISEVLYSDRRILTEADTIDSVELPYVSDVFGLNFVTIAPDMISNELPFSYDKTDKSPVDDSVVFESVSHNEDKVGLSESSSDSSDAIDSVSYDEDQTESFDTITDAYNPCTDKEGSEKCDMVDGSSENLDPKPSSDQLYVLTPKSILYYDDLSKQEKPLSLFQFAAEEQKDLSLSSGGFIYRGHTCALGGTIAVVVQDRTANKYYLMEVNLDADSVVQSYCASKIAEDSQLLDNSAVTVSEYALKAKATEDNSSYVLWDTSSDMIDVLELSNKNYSSAGVDLSVFGESGRLLKREHIIIPSNAQKDVVVNDLPGVVKNSRGTLKITTKKSFSSSGVDGRLSVYKTSKANTDLVFVMPVEQAKRSVGLVGYNTFNPSKRRQDVKDSVSNWLSIANLSKEKAKFEIQRYDEAGRKINSEVIKIASMGRVEIQGSHVSPDQSHTGVIKVMPVDNTPKVTTQYTAQLTRYTTNKAGLLKSVMPVSVEEGNSLPLFVGVSSEDAVSDSIEVINASVKPADTVISCYDAAGTEMFGDSVTIPSYGKKSLEIAPFFKKPGFGNCEVNSNSGAPLIANSLIYAKSSNKGVTSAARLRGRSPIARLVSGSYNLYLDTRNEVRLSNPTDKKLVARLSVFEANGKKGRLVGNKSISIAPRASVSVDIAKNSKAIKVTPNTYGVLRISSKSGVVYGHVVRKRKDRGVLDFSVPTEIR